ncbi:MAG: SUMF1/EgtB/PvdO family nonheme iron enzyme, partial [Tannerellaceae bacterium]|nr:SUMF1/EgtB/PvdO family nonheme iron enzyme [Tannerellaceae bacterium]
KAEAIVLPMTDITATPVPLRIMLNGKEYAATLPPVAGFTGIEAGYRYVYTVSVSDGSAGLSGVATPWNTEHGDDIPFDEEKPGPTPAPPLPASPIPMSMELINKGTFMMGSLDEEVGRGTNETLHEVTISDDFYISRYATTNAEFAAFLNAEGVGSDGEGIVDGYGNQLLIVENTVMGLLWDNNEWKPVNGMGTHPVIHVTWYGAKAFADWVGMTLPTEAQWEYACRAGSQAAWCFGDDVNLLENYAWYYPSAGSTTHPVGEKSPNAWGLYDMHGNVCEWCSDWYNGENKRVRRSGSWNMLASFSRSASRFAESPSDTKIHLGFRVAYVP